MFWAVAKSKKAKMSYTMKILTQREGSVECGFGFEKETSRTQTSTKILGSSGGQKVHSLKYWAHLEGRKSVHESKTKGGKIRRNPE